MKLLLRFIFRRSQLDADMATEMRAHVEEQTQRNISAGMSEAAARAAAHRQFGGVAQIQERARDARRFMWAENLVRDTGFAVRSLRKNPGFTSVIVFTLALGLGVNTALFTWFNAAAFRPLPVQSPEQLYTIERLDPRGEPTNSMSYPDFVAYRDHQTAFAGVTASSTLGVQLADAAEAAAVTGERLTELRIDTVATNYFAVFGVPIALGRPLIAADETSSSALPVIVISHHFWQNHLGGDPAVIGRTLRLRGLAQETLTIVGVTGPEFYGTKPGALAGWVPLFMRPGETWRTNLKMTPFRLTGRLRAGISREQAADELTAIANASLARPRSGPATAETISLTAATTYLNLTAKHLLLLLPIIGLFGAVFVISCANASNLILARAVTRQFEFAVRAALGATRRRLVTLLMTECLVLGVLAGAAGWAVSAALLRFAWPWLLDMMPGAREGTAGLHLTADYRVFAFTLVVSVLAGAAGGLFPALQVTRRNVDAALKRDGSVFGPRLRLSRLRNVLAVTQLALSSALLFTAGLLVHRALRTQLQDLGFDQSRMLSLEVLAPRTYEPGQLDTARRQVLERIRAMPDVAAVSALFRFPFAQSSAPVSVPAANPAEHRTFGALHTAVPSDYFATLQLPLLRGRGFAANETPDDRVVVISESAARTFWPGRDALGQRFDVRASLMKKHEPSPAALEIEADQEQASVTVIGIARDTGVYDPWSGNSLVVYLPLQPSTTAAPYLLIRTTGGATLSSTALAQVSREVTGIAPRIVTVSDLFANAFIQYRVIAWVGGILAVLSLVVAVIGLYGVMSFTVNQRVKEIGIRMALGASPGRVATGIVLESLRLVLGGAIVGYGLCVGITVVARTILFGVNALDPVAGVVVALFLAVVSLFACWSPAHRASRVDPMVALRTE